MLTAFPFTAGLVLRLDFFKEQPLVPMALVGVDYWLWKENWYVNEDVSSEEGLITGGEAGYHYGFGINLLLDWLEPGRASQLSARTGIDDTYIVAEWRKQTVGQWGEDGSSLFDASLVTIGFKLDM